MHNMQALLANISDEQLRSFILEYAELDGSFANTLSVRFAEPDFDAEVDKIARMVAYELEDANDYRRRGSWGYIEFDLVVADREIDQRISKGQLRLAFAQAAAVYAELLEVYEYQEECEISDAAESYIDIMEHVAEKVKDTADREYIYNRSIDLAHNDTASDYGGDYEDRFLKIAVQFVTPENRAEFDKAVIKFSDTWRAGTFALIQLSAIGRLEGKRAAEKYIMDNLSYDEIRKAAYDNAIKAHDTEKAAQLCLDAPESTNWKAPDWKQLLFAAYETADDVPKMAEAARSLVLSGDLSYYRKLKELHTKTGDWVEVYPDMLAACEAQLGSLDYMVILSGENELERLLQQLETHQSSVYQYGKQLAKKYPDEVARLFIDELDKESAKAGNRKEYALICTHIKIFRSAGYDELAATLISEYKQRFNRRPAFVDELSRV